MSTKPSAIGVDRKKLTLAEKVDVEQLFELLKWVSDEEVEYEESHRSAKESGSLFCPTSMSAMLRGDCAFKSAHLDLALSQNPQRRILSTYMLAKIDITEDLIGK